MKKLFYHVSNVLLSSLIALLGFGSCKTTKEVSKEKVDANTEASTPYGDKTGKSSSAEDSLKAKPRPIAPTDRVVVLYGVRPPQQQKIKELVPKEPNIP